MILALERDFYGAVAGDCFSGATTCGWPHLGANRGEKHFVPLHLHVLHKRSISLSWCTTGRATRSQDKTNDFLTLIFCGSGLSNTTPYCDAATVEKQEKVKQWGVLLLSVPSPSKMAWYVATAHPPSHVIHHIHIRKFGMFMQVYMHNMRDTQEKNFAQNDIEKKEYLKQWIIQLHCKFSLLASCSKSEANRQELVSPCAVPLFIAVTCSFLQAWGQPLKSFLIATVQTHFHFLS